MSDEEVEPYSMLEWPTVERTRIADGTEFVLGRFGNNWVIRVGAKILMSNHMHDSEEALAKEGLSRVKNPRSILVGGLGLGYTARAVLDRVAPDAEVTVVEFMPEVIDWNRRYLGALANHPLDDPRCKLVLGDVFETLKRSPGAFDVVLLDVDNGPQELTQAKNQRIYSEWGVRFCMAAVKPGGVLAVWSQGPNASYERKLGRYAAHVEVLEVDARADLRWLHIVFVATAKSAPTSVD